MTHFYAFDYCYSSIIFVLPADKTPDYTAS